MQENAFSHNVNVKILTFCQPAIYKLDVFSDQANWGSVYGFGQFLSKLAILLNFAGLTRCVGNNQKIKIALITVEECFWVKVFYPVTTGVATE